MSADTDVPEGLPIIAHLSSEFFAWIWWTSEQQGSAFELGPPVGQVDVWIDERLAFRAAEDTRVTAVMTGENPSASLEARAALAGGKVLQEVRLGIRREDREFFVTLKGPAMHVTGLKLPAVVTDGDAEVVFERVHLYDELVFVLSHLYRRFAEVRIADDWRSEVLPGLHDWILARRPDPYTLADADAADTDADDDADDDAADDADDADDDDDAEDDAAEDDDDDEDDGDLDQDLDSYLDEAPDRPGSA